MPSIDFSQQMDAVTRHATGVERLSPAERVALAQWLADYIANTHPPSVDQSLPPAGNTTSSTALMSTAAPPPVAASSAPSTQATFGAEHLPDNPLTSAPDRVLATIEGPFTGWNGTTIFRLNNGQVWRQTDSSRFYYPVDNPVVIIERGAMGAYYLRVDGKSSVVRVRRMR
jgi:hypothetical protein